MDAGRKTKARVVGQPIKFGGQYRWAATVVKRYKDGSSRVASLLVLQHYHVDTQTAWCSQAGLAEDLGMKETSVQRIISGLINDGFLKANRKFGGSYRYQLTIPNPAEMKDMNPSSVRGMDISNPAAVRGLEDAEITPYPAALGGHTPQDCGLISVLDSVQGAGLQPDPLSIESNSTSDNAREVDPFEDELRPDQVPFYRNLRKYDRAYYQRLSEDDRDNYAAAMDTFDDD